MDLNRYSGILGLLSARGYMYGLVENVGYHKIRKVDKDYTGLRMCGCGSGDPCESHGIKIFVGYDIEQNVSIDYFYNRCDWKCGLCREFNIKLNMSHTTYDYCAIVNSKPFNSLVKKVLDELLDISDQRRDKEVARKFEQDEKNKLLAEELLTKIGNSRESTTT